MMEKEELVLSLVLLWVEWAVDTSYSKYLFLGQGLYLCYGYLVNYLDNS